MTTITKDAAVTIAYKMTDPQTGKPLEHFSAFYQLQNNQPLTAEQAAFCQQLIEEIWKEGEDA